MDSLPLGSLARVTQKLFRVPGIHEFTLFCLPASTQYWGRILRELGNQIDPDCDVRNNDSGIGMRSLNGRLMFISLVVKIDSLRQYIWLSSNFYWVVVAHGKFWTPLRLLHGCFVPFPRQLVSSAGTCGFCGEYLTRNSGNKHKITEDNWPLIRLHMEEHHKDRKQEWFRFLNTPIETIDLGD